MRTKFSFSFLPREFYENFGFCEEAQQEERKCAEISRTLVTRSELLDSLVDAYGLLDCVTEKENFSVEKIQYQLANKITPEFYQFHSKKYLEQIAATYANLSDDCDEVHSSSANSHGIGKFDCPLDIEFYLYALNATLLSINAARWILQDTKNCDNVKKSKVAINFHGGWHHGARSKAAGYCLFNDIAISIEILRERFKKIMYIDLDLHHPDAIEDAYKYSSNVFIVSVHKHSAGFYPGTGLLSTKNSLNVPIHQSGICDEQMMSIVKQALAHKSVINFNPDCIVLQLGLDGLLGDPHKQFALTEKFYLDATKHLLNQAYPELPFLILGGGGYNPQECAKCWTFVTSSILNVELDQNLPEHSHLAQYGPSYCIHTEKNYTSMNKPDLELNSLIKFS